MLVLCTFKFPAKNFKKNFTECVFYRYILMRNRRKIGRVEPEILKKKLKSHIRSYRGHVTTGWSENWCRSIFLHVLSSHPSGIPQSVWGNFHYLNRLDPLNKMLLSWTVSKVFSILEIENIMPTWNKFGCNSLLRL